MATIRTEEDMYIPEDLKQLYDKYLDLVSRGTEHASLPIEFVMALIERVGDLEQDSENLDSYLHYKCRQKQKTLENRLKALEVKTDGV